MESRLVWIVAAIGSGTLLGVFWRMKSGFGPYNLRVVGIVLVATLASLLTLRPGSSETAGMGILGAIAGYVFGLKDSKDS